MEDKVELPKMPWTVRVPMLELYALAALCVGYAVYLTSPLTAISEGRLLRLGLDSSNAAYLPPVVEEMVHGDEGRSVEREIFV